MRSRVGIEPLSRSPAERAGHLAEGRTDLFGASGESGRDIGSSNSLSGNERNHLFLNLEGRSFEDVSAISGLDHPADGRAAAALDYDRDGWLDFAVTNANSPLFQLFRNQVASVRGAEARDHGMVALRFVGANRSASRAEGKSNRDGFGAVFEIRVDGATLLREHRAGDGFAAQNSATELVGLGEAAGVDELRVRWPSGVVQTREQIPAFSLVTVYEDPSEAADGSGFQIEPYRKSGVVTPASRVAGAPLALGPEVTDGHAVPLRVLVTMATWCEACTSELPQVARLRTAFAEDQLDLVGVPVDEDDDDAALAAYLEAHAPAYRLLEPLDSTRRQAVQDVIVDALMVDALPATIVTDGGGRVVRTLTYVPSISAIRHWLTPEPAPGPAPW